MMDIVGGLIGAGTSIAGGIMGANAANSAAKEEAGAIQQGLNFEQGVYGTTQQNLNPYIGTGQNALYSLASLYGLPEPNGAPAGAGSGALNAYHQFTQTPYYQFPLQQGEEAMNRSGAARGLTLSGGQMNALQAYGQGYASQNFGNYVNQLSQLAGMGQQAGTSLGGLGNQAGGIVLQGSTGVGNALASGTMGANKALNKGIQGAIPFITGGQNSSFMNNGGVLGSAYNALAGAGAWNVPAGSAGSIF